MEQVKKFFTPTKPTLTLFVRTDKIYSKVYIEIELADGNCPKQPRQFYLYQICEPEQQEQCMKQLQEVFNKLFPFPEYEWHPEPAQYKS